MKDTMEDDLFKQLIDSMEDAKKYEEEKCKPGNYASLGTRTENSKSRFFETAPYCEGKS